LSNLTSPLPRFLWQSGLLLSSGFGGRFFSLPLVDFGYFLFRFSDRVARAPLPLLFKTNTGHVSFFSSPLPNASAFLPGCAEITPKVTHRVVFSPLQLFSQRWSGYCLLPLFVLWTRLLFPWDFPHVPPLTRFFFPSTVFLCALRALRTHFLPQIFIFFFYAEDSLRVSRSFASLLQNLSKFTHRFHLLPLPSPPNSFGGPPDFMKLVRLPATFPLFDTGRPPFPVFQPPSAFAWIQAGLVLLFPGALFRLAILTFHIYSSFGFPFLSLHCPRAVFCFCRPPPPRL